MAEDAMSVMQQPEHSTAAEGRDFPRPIWRQLSDKFRS